MESMVVGKSSILALIISVSILSGCANTQETYLNSSSVGSSANTTYLETSTSVATVVNLFRWSSAKLPKEDQLKQEQAVFYALDNLEEGQVTKWYNAKNGSQGAVKVVMTYPSGSGFCRVLLSQITYKNKTRDFKETACINHLRTWKFIR